MSDLVPRKTLVKQATKGLGGLGGGIVLLVLSSLGGVPALVVGGVLAVVGAVISTSKDDRSAGLVTAAAGVLTILAGIPLAALSAISGSLMIASGIGLIAAGGYNLFKFIRGLKSRS